MSDRFRLKVLEVSAARKELLAKRWPNVEKFDPELADYVQVIIDEVKRRGDAALVDLTLKFDGLRLSPDRLRVTREDIERAYENVSEEQISAIEFMKGRIEAFQKEILGRISFEYEREGVRIRSCTSPIRRVGCYVPGGQAAYPSSLIMTIVPAKVAGVPEVVVCSPPRTGGEIDQLVLVSADICRADEIYGVGGVQAIAAMAYGTETIKPVDKLVGPGNRYVLMAKMLVSQDVPTDFPAGPSEIVTLADDSADPRTVAFDMVSQAEHIDGVSILVTPSRAVAHTVSRELEHMVSSLPNKDTVVKNLSSNASAVVCTNVQEAVRFVNEFAPEHVEVMMEDGWGIAEKITTAGIVLVGKYTPVSASDYCLGTNHILPTNGFSHVYSGLSVLDFVKRFSIAECSEKGLMKVRKPLKVLAESESLPNHALATEERFVDA